MNTSLTRVAGAVVLTVLMGMVSLAEAQSSSDVPGEPVSSSDDVPVDLRVVISDVRGGTTMSRWAYQVQTLAMAPMGKTQRARVSLTAPVRSVTAGDGDESADWSYVGPQITGVIMTRADRRFTVSLTLGGMLSSTGIGKEQVQGGASPTQPLRLNVEHLGVVTAGQATRLLSMSHPVVPDATIQVDVTVTPVR
jgi:hypothetical protein